MNTLFETLGKIRIPLSLKNIKRLFLFGILTFFAFILWESIYEGTMLWKQARDESGELAWNLLLFIIFSGLLSKIFPSIQILRQILPLRKEAGISVFLIICFHAIFHFARMDVLTDLLGIYEETWGNNWVVIIGTIAFLIMIPLFLTSTEKAQKKMGYQFWKNLQRLSHLVFILSAIHVGFVDYPEYSEVEPLPIIFLTLYSAGYFWLFWRKQKEKK